MKNQKKDLEPSTGQGQKKCVFTRIKNSVKKSRANFRHNDSIGWVDSLFDLHQLSDLTGW